MNAQRPRPPQFRGEHTRAEWRDHVLPWLVTALLAAVMIVLIVWVANPAPPRTITISAGPRDSSFIVTANQYKKILARNGIRLNVLESDGSVQNLKRLLDPQQHVDLALVQGGAAEGIDTSSLISLGSMFYVPIVVFYRGTGHAQLSDFAGKRIAIGREGSGTRLLALQLLAANDIEPGGNTGLVPTDGLEAATQLVSGDVDAAILSGDSATRGLMLRLLRVPGISVMSFDEASAYTRLFPFLDRIDLPPGVLDLKRRIPPETVHLISPTVELVARSTLHPAISDLLIEAAQEVHGKAGLLQHAGQFPNPVEHEYPISEDAQRYYRTGKGFLYRALPFWLASIGDRALVLLLPIAVLLVPAMRVIPALYRWRVRSRIYRYYGSLIAIERHALAGATDAQRDELLAQLDEIEVALNSLRLPLAYADGFYVLREHVGFVRSRLTAARPVETS